MKFGVFDSGIGGKAIASALQITFPQAEMIVIDDHQNVPYGKKSSEQIIELTDKSISRLINQKCDVIILACNTATAVAIDFLRNKYPDQKFIGIEPMVKTAAMLTKTKTIAIFATPATLASNRYKKLLAKYGTNLTVLEPDCSDWASMIEFNHINYQQISKVIDNVCNKGADIIVLGCTHYNWIKDSIIKMANGRAKIIEPSEAIGRRVKSLLKLDK